MSQVYHRETQFVTIYGMIFYFQKLVGGIEFSGILRKERKIDFFMN